MEDARTLARRLARESLSKGDATGWFERLYETAQGDAGRIQWADLHPNPGLVEWARAKGLSGNGNAALVVGCGLGDDAEEMARLGFRVTAFDISETAVAWCRRRFPVSSAADLFAPPVSWAWAFDFVLEAYTLQVLPSGVRRRAAERLASFVAPGGTLLVICRGRGHEDDPGAMPWPLTLEELDYFRQAGLREAYLEDYLDRETPPVRRFRAEYRR
jgi:SAM-dependent methyltransferase